MPSTFLPLAAVAPAVLSIPAAALWLATDATLAGNEQPVEDVAWPGGLTQLVFGSDFNQPVNSVDWPKVWMVTVSNKNSGRQTFTSSLGRGLCSLCGAPAGNRAVGRSTFLFDRRYSCSIVVFRRRRLLITAGLVVAVVVGGVGESARSL